MLCEGQHPLRKATPLSPRTEHRRSQALDRSLAEDKIEDICRQLACAKSWRYKGRARYEATNPAWVQERSQRPKHSSPQTPAHVARAIVSLQGTFRQNGTGGSATTIMRALTQQGLAPVPSRRTMYRMVRRHHQEVQ